MEELMPAVSFHCVFLFGTFYLPDKFDNLKTFPKSKYEMIYYPYLEGCDMIW